MEYAGQQGTAHFIVDGVGVPELIVHLEHTKMLLTKCLILTDFKSEVERYKQFFKAETHENRLIRPIYIYLSLRYKYYTIFI